MAFDKIRKIFKKEVHLYKGCSDLSIHNFDIVYKSKDFRYLVVGFNGYDKIRLPDNVEERWRDIFDEWVKIKDDNSILYYYQLISQVAYLETRFIVAQALLLQIYEREMNEKTLDLYIEMLRPWRYVYNKNNNKIDELTRLFNQHQASQNKLGLKRSELKQLQEENNGDNSQTLEAQAVSLEQITGRNNIDPKTTSVIKWNEICKLADSINSQRRKQYGK